MTVKTNQLQNLIQLAQEQSSDGRRELLHEITDLFVDSHAVVSEQESHDFAEIVGQLVFDVEMDVRKHLAQRLATLENAPHNLVTMLANDEIDVARPLLVNSPVLQNADLIRIIKKRSQEHMLSVSRRSEVDGDVAAALVEHGDDRVHESLARNPGASLPRGAAQTLVSRSERNHGLQEPLITRADLPPDLINQMYFWVSEKLRERIMQETHDLDETVIDNLLKEAQSAVVTEMAYEADVDAEPSPAEKFIRRKALLKQLSAPLLVELLRDGRMAEFLEGFARLTGLDNETAQRVLSDPTHQGLAIACKACGIEKDQFATLARLTSSDGTLDADDIFEVIDMYEKIPMEAARRTMRFWRVRQVAGDGVHA
jgi:uncharacterized protein (DUF2336 family)